MTDPGTEPLTERVTERVTPRRTQPWHGLLVATALPLRNDLSVDYEAYGEHCRWLVEQGCDGVVPNGSLGEYQTLSDEERSRVVETAVAAVGGARVVPGVAAYGARAARRWAEQAVATDCRSVLLLPPNGYRADERAVLGHFTAVAEAGLPVIAYNNPHDTRVDLAPSLLARLYGEGAIVAVKEFSGDVRRSYEIAELAPGLDVLAGADDVLLELAVSGAVGWVAGYPNALPASCAALYHAGVSGDLAAALPLYRALHPLLRWDSRTEFVQAIKASMEVAGRYGGPCRPPRVPLTAEQDAMVRAATGKLLAAGHR
ncbi:dihydrodipicolinate synthase family protein [Streptomyces gobiensis]|uniref:dihydrodipicolinate synthase family protein n=1 Tax=Streptomyces gobiensis TaxID=2875706 RepID=UPI001E5611BC|nr:dihydrodipicolinate synthase family protein [Streptomyces gobiensis]UGY94830.1 dihydrodipicolinate synthase family protein [Streptomyces gobiensis]